MNSASRLLGAIACLCAVTALAQTAKSTAPKVISAPKLMEDGVTDLRAYWTPERLASAKPMPIPVVDASSVVQTAAPAPEPEQFSPGHGPLIQLTASPNSSSERFPLDTGDAAEADASATPTGFNYVMPFTNYRTGNNTQYPYTAMGKLFFTIPKGASEPAGTYVCSASVISDGRGKTGITLLTARHCMYDPAKKVWYQNWVYYPGWNNGSDAALGGGWTPNRVATWGGGSLTSGYDIGMMEMHDLGGRGCNGNVNKTLGSVGGWLGWTYNGDYSQRQWNIFGYPQGAPFEGNYLYNDEGATGAVNPLGSNMVVEAGNPQTGGTSGGPWVIGFDPGNGPLPPCSAAAGCAAPGNNIAYGHVNLANGVNSFVWTNPSQPLALNGTMFFTANFANLLNTIKGYSCN